MTWNRRANKKSGGSWQDDSWENQINQDSWNKWQGAQADSDDREAGATSSWGNQSNWKEPQSRSGHGHGSGYGSHGHGCSSWQEQEDWQNSHEPQEEDWWNSSKPQEDWQNSREPQEEDWWNSSKPQEDWRKSQRSQASGQRHTGGQQTSQAWSGYSARGSADPWHAYGKNDQHSQDNWKEDPWAGWNNQSGQNGNDWSKSTQDNWKEDPWAGWNNQSGQNGNDWSKSAQDNWKEDPWAGNEQSGQNGNDWSNSAQAWGQDKWNAVERWGDKLKEVDWQERPQVNIRKNFYEECANEAALSRTPEEVERIRQSHFIEIFDGCSDEHPVPNVINSFDEACFSPKMMASLRERFEEPTPIQKQIWPLAMQGRDVVGIAETGSGKTVAYLLPMICHIVYQEELQPGDGPVALILTPTRELAKQIQEQCELFGSLNGLKSCTVVGGTPSSEQKEHLQGKNDIVVATPGRFMTALGEEWVMLNRATYVVLDEADEMLKKEFYEQIKLILSQVRKERQVLMFSATWPEEVRILAQEICTDSDGMPPVFVRIGGDKLAACKDIEQHTVLVDGDEDKYDKLKERLQSPDTFKDGGKAIIFCRTRGAVMRLHEQLEKEEFMWKDGESLVAMLHGEMRQSDRDWAMLQFRQGDLPCVISTGVLARGHDIPKVRFVFNYDVPREAEDYIHRVGRTGRAGAKGYSMIFVDKSNSKELQAAHAFLMGVLQATDQTVEEDFKEAVENYEQSQNQTFYGDGAGWDGWDVEDTKHEAADGDAAQEQWPEGTQGTEWQGGATEGAYAAAEEEAGWQQEAAGGDAAHAAQEQWSESNQWQAQYEQWPEGTQWQEQCEQWPEGTQGTLWQGGATEGAYAAAEEEAGWQQEAAGGDAAHAAQEKWPESTQWQGVTTEDAHAAAEAPEGDAAQQKGVTTEDAHAAAEAAEGDAAQQKGVATEDAHAAAEAQAEASLEASQEAAEGDAAQQKGETTEDAHAAAEEHWPEGTQGREWQGGTTEGGHDAAEEQQQWQGSAWQATVADATQEKEHWQGYYAPWQGGTTEGAYTSAEEPWQSHTQWQQAHQWNQWQQEQTFTPAVDVEIVSPPFTLGEDDAVKQQNATVGQEGDEGTWWEEAGERPSEGIEHENIPETCPVISIDKDPSAQQKDADPSLEQKETSDEKVTEEDPSAQQKDADPSLEQKETSDEKVTEEVEKESTAASAWQ